MRKTNRLTRSTIPLAHGAATPTSTCLILRFLQKASNSWEVNAFPRSETIRSGFPKILNKADKCLTTSLEAVVLTGHSHVNLEK